MSEDEPNSRIVPGMQEPNIGSPDATIHDEPAMTPENPIRIPDNVHRALIEEYADKHSRINNLENSGWTLPAAEVEVLGSRGIYDEEGRLIGTEASPDSDMPSPDQIRRYVEEVQKPARERRKPKLR